MRRRAGCAAFDDDRARRHPEHPRQRRLRQHERLPRLDGRGSGPRPARRRRARPRRPAATGCRPACVPRARARRGARRRPAPRRPPVAATTARNAAPTALSHVEPGQRLVGARPGDGRFRAATVASRRPKSNGSHENSAPAALPQTLSAEADGSTGPEIAGMTDCGQQLAEDVVGRRAVRSARARRVAGDRRPSRRSTPAVDAFTCSNRRL